MGLDADVALAVVLAVTQGNWPSALCARRGLEQDTPAKRT